MLPDVVVPSFKRRLTGVTTTMRDAVQAQKAEKPDFSIGVLGNPFSDTVRRVPLSGIFRFGWQQPAGKPFRIWHARRNTEMVAGIIARYVLGMKFKLVFTSAAIRRHSFIPRLLIACMDEIIAVSDKAGKAIDELHSDIKHAPHGVNLEKFSPVADKEAAAAALGLSPAEQNPVHADRLRLGLFGRVRREKGTDLFVDALCRVLPDNPNASAYIIGRCTPAFRLFQAGLKAKLKKAGLASRVHFTGEVPFDHISTWYQAMDVCVACPRYEGYGMTPLEAMACGCAILASDTGAFANFIDEGTSGFLVPVRDAEALSEKMSLLLRDKSRVRQMGKAGRNRAEAGFSIRDEARAINALYQRMWQQGACPDTESGL